MLLAANSATAKPANAVALLRDAAARTAIARAAATVPINDSNFTLIHAGAAAALSVAAYEVLGFRHAASRKTTAENEAIAPQSGFLSCPAWRSLLYRCATS